MSESEKIDQEPEEKEKASPREAFKVRRALSKVRRELSEEEFATPAAVRLLLDAIDQAEQLVIELSEFRDRFHKCDKEKAVLEERNRRTLAIDVAFTVFLSIGVGLIGFTPFLWTIYPNEHIVAYIVEGVGIVLIITGVLTKVVHK